MCQELWNSCHYWATILGNYLAKLYRAKSLIWRNLFSLFVRWVALLSVLEWENILRSSGIMRAIARSFDPRNSHSRIRLHRIRPISHSFDWMFLDRVIRAASIGWLDYQEAANLRFALPPRAPLFHFLLHRVLRFRLEYRESLRTHCNRVTYSVPLICSRCDDSLAAYFYFLDSWNSIISSCALIISRSRKFGLASFHSATPQGCETRIAPAILALERIFVLAAIIDGNHDPIRWLHRLRFAYRSSASVIRSRLPRCAIDWLCKDFIWWPNILGSASNLVHANFFVFWLYSPLRSLSEPKRHPFWLPLALESLARANIIYLWLTSLPLSLWCFDSLSISDLDHSSLRSLDLRFTYFLVSLIVFLETQEYVDLWSTDSWRARFLSCEIDLSISLGSFAALLRETYRTRFFFKESSTCWLSESKIHVANSLEKLTRSSTTSTHSFDTYVEFVVDFVDSSRTNEGISEADS